MLGTSGPKGIFNFVQDARVLPRGLVAPALLVENKQRVSVVVISGVLHLVGGHLGYRCPPQQDSVEGPSTVQRTVGGPSTEHFFAPSFCKRFSDVF